VIRSVAVSFIDILRYLLGFHLSSKAKFAIKASLSIVIVYIIAFYQGWQSPSTSAITISLVASIGSLQDTLKKGAFRTIGTLIGAILGMILIALYPQDRFDYLLSSSILVALVFYIGRIYRGDTTILFLTGMTIMLVFQNNQAQDAFIYGLNRTYMTIFGVMVYTIVDVMLWKETTPQEDNTLKPLLDIKDSLGIDKKHQLHLKSSKIPNFNFYDTEAIKVAIVSFLVYWASAFVWIYFNPAMGFYVVVLATSFSFLTAFSPIHPLLLMMLYTLAFIGALISYIFILPNLTSMWQFDIYLFIYCFIAFYFIDLRASVFFIIALSTLNLANDMSYSFSFVALSMLCFYMFLFVLLFFYYVPFSTKAEYLYRVHHKKLFKTLANMIKNRQKPKDIHTNARIVVDIINKMQMWAESIDSRYFDIDKTKLQKLITNAKKLTYLTMVYVYEYQDKNSDIDSYMIEVFKELEECSLKHTKDIDTTNLNYIQKDIYQILKDTLVQCKDINFEKLKEGRF